MIAVVLHAVAAARDLFHQLGVGGGPFPDAEKARLGLVAIEQFQHPGGHFGIGTVVERERDFAATHRGSGQAHEVRPQQLSARTQHREKEREMIRSQHGQSPRPRVGVRREHEGRPYLAAEAYSFFVAAGKVDGYALARTHRTKELRRSDLIRAEVFPQARFDRAQRLAQEERPGDDRISGEMPLSRGVIRREGPLDRRQGYPALASRATRSSSVTRGSLPVSLRGRDSTRQSGRGRKAGSIRWRRPAMMVSLASPGATTKAVNRVTVPSSSSGITKAPSLTPSMELR